jgi:hypothetical protein
MDENFNAQQFADWIKSKVNRFDWFQVYRPELQRYIPTRDLSDNTILLAAKGLLAISIYPTGTKGSLWAAIDIDNKDPNDTAKATANETLARSIVAVAESMGLQPMLLKSNTWGGFHILIFFKTPQPYERVNALAKQLVGENQLLYMPHILHDRTPTVQTTSLGSAIRVPGLHIDAQCPSEVWSNDHWVLWGTQEWNDVLSTYQGVENPNLPEATIPEYARPPVVPSPAHQLPKETSLANVIKGMAPKIDQAKINEAQQKMLEKKAQVAAERKRMQELCKDPEFVAKLDPIVQEYLKKVDWSCKCPHTNGFCEILKLTDAYKSLAV